MELQIILNSFATDVFRKQADYDYISARMNYRMRLRQQFLWSAQQAVEKYLKAILLYNGKSARYYITKNSPKEKEKKKEFSHDLIALNNEVCKLDFLKYELPDWAPSYIKYLKELGGLNRYLTNISYNAPDAILKLDELVWNIRRYCQYIPDRGLGCTHEIRGMREAVINFLNNPDYRKKPTTFKLFSGELERILKRDHRDLARKALVWANLFYGEETGKCLDFALWFSSEIPPQHSDWFNNEESKVIISEYIKL